MLKPHRQGAHNKTQPSGRWNRVAATQTARRTLKRRLRRRLKRCRARRGGQRSRRKKGARSTRRPKKSGKYQEKEKAKKHPRVAAPGRSVSAAGQGLPGLLWGRADTCRTPAGHPLRAPTARQAQEPKRQDFSAQASEKRHPERSNAAYANAAHRL